MTNRSTLTSACWSSLPLLFVWDPQLHSVITGWLFCPVCLFFFAKWATLSPTRIICAQHITHNVWQPKVSEMTVILIWHLGRLSWPLHLIYDLLLHLCCCLKVSLLFWCSSICEWSHGLHLRGLFKYISHLKAAATRTTLPNWSGVGGCTLTLSSVVQPRVQNVAPLIFPLLKCVQSTD